MAIDLSELQDIDIGDLSTWPRWFKGFAVFAVFCGLLYAGYHYLISEQIRELDTLTREEGSLKKTFLDRKGRAINLPTYREQMKQMEETFAVMVDQLPDKTEVPELLIDITQAGLSRGLEFDLFQPVAEQVSGFYAILPVNVRVRGAYHQFGLFLSDLASLSRIVTVGNLGISSTPQGVLTISAVVRTFRYLDEDAAYSGQRQKDKAVRTVRE